MTSHTSRGTVSLNPFFILVDVAFTGPGGKKYKVPGFYNGGGKGGLDGNVWKEFFSADETGIWTFKSESSNDELDGYTWCFTVNKSPNDAPDFYRWGRIEYFGTSANKVCYLKISSGISAIITHSRRERALRIISRTRASTRRTS